LITVPKSTLDNWKREFEKWTPDVKVMVLQGTKEERQKLIQERVLTDDFDCLITSYEMILREKTHLKKFAWEYIIVDEVSHLRRPQSVFGITERRRHIVSRMKSLLLRKLSVCSIHVIDSLSPVLLFRITSTSSGRYSISYCLMYSVTLLLLMSGSKIKAAIKMLLFNNCIKFYGLSCSAESRVT